jgi:hypothetical protein
MIAILMTSPFWTWVQKHRREAESGDLTVQGQPEIHSETLSQKEAIKLLIQFVGHEIYWSERLISNCSEIDLNLLDDGSGSPRALGFIGAFSSQG